MMRNATDARSPSNPALDLVRVAKEWTINLCRDRLNPPSQLKTVIGQLPFTSYLRDQEEKLQHPRPQTVAYYLNQLDFGLIGRDAKMEAANFAKLKERLKNPATKKGKQLAFLLGFYERLDKLASTFVHYQPGSAEFSGQNNPRLQINRALRTYSETKEELAEGSGIFPAKLDLQLREKEAQLGMEALVPPAGIATGAIQVSIRTARPRTAPAAVPVAIHPIPTPPESLTALDLPPVLALPELAIPDLSGLLDPAKTFQKYKKAAEQYNLHLLAAIMDEIEDCHDDNPRHVFFQALPERKSNKRRDIALALLNAYDIPRRRQQLDEAIGSTRPQFYVAWEKYKIVRKLRESEDVAGFHGILVEGKNKEILTTVRDEPLMRFVKYCGLAVATLLGLPLGIVGGYLLAHRSLFGSRATEGHLFLKEIDNLTEEGKKPESPGHRRCCW